jgi:hypothetical protein
MGVTSSSSNRFGGLCVIGAGPGEICFKGDVLLETVLGVAAAVPRAVAITVYEFSGGPRSNRIGEHARSTVRPVYYAVPTKDGISDYWQRLYSVARKVANGLTHIGESASSVTCFGIGDTQHDCGSIRTAASRPVSVGNTRSINSV